MKNKSITYTRSIAALFVLLGHCCYAYRGGWKFDVQECEFAVHITEYLYSFHMALFMMISGIVFSLAYSSGTIPYKKFIKKRFVRLIIPLVFVKFVIWNPINMTIGNYKVSDVGKLLTELGHTWYLAVLFIISVAAYLIVKIEKGVQQQEKKTFVIIVAAIFCLTLALFSEILPSGGKSTVEALYFYPLFFAAGIAMDRFKFYDRNNIVKTLPILVHILVSIINYVGFVESIVWRIITAMAGAVAWISIGDIINSHFGNGVCSFFERIEKNSMAIYLIHLPIIYLILGTTKLGLFAPTLVIVILFIVAGLGSCIAGGVLRKMGLSKLIGE